MIRPPRTTSTSPGVNSEIAGGKQIVPPFLQGFTARAGQVRALEGK